MMSTYTQRRSDTVTTVFRLATTPESLRIEKGFVRDGAMWARDGFRYTAVEADKLIQRNWRKGA